MIKDIYVAIETCDISKLEELIQQGVEFKKYLGGETLLTLAIKRQAEGVVTHLVESALFINQAGKNGRTPLMEAVTSGNGLLIKKLVNFGADIEAISDNEETVFSLVKELGNVEERDSIIGFLEKNRKLSKRFSFKNFKDLLIDQINEGLNENDDDDLFLETTDYLSSEDFEQDKYFRDDEEDYISIQELESTFDESDGSTENLGELEQKEMETLLTKQNSKETTETTQIDELNLEEIKRLLELKRKNEEKESHLQKREIDNEASDENLIQEKQNEEEHRRKDEGDYDENEPVHKTKKNVKNNGNKKVGSDSGVKKIESHELSVEQSKQVISEFKKKDQTAGRSENEKLVKEHLHENFKKNTQKVAQLKKYLDPDQKNMDLKKNEKNEQASKLKKATLEDVQNQIKSAKTLTRDEKKNQLKIDQKWKNENNANEKNNADKIEKDRARENSRSHINHQEAKVESIKKTVGLVNPEEQKSKQDMRDKKEESNTLVSSKTKLQNNISKTTLVDTKINYKKESNISSNKKDFTSKQSDTDANVLEVEKKQTKTPLNETLIKKQTIPEHLEKKVDKKDTLDKENNNPAIGFKHKEVDQDSSNGYRFQKTGTQSSFEKSRISHLTDQTSSICNEQKQHQELEKAYHQLPYAIRINHINEKLYSPAEKQFNQKNDSHFDLSNNEEHLKTKKNIYADYDGSIENPHKGNFRDGYDLGNTFVRPNVTQIEKISELKEKRNEDGEDALIIAAKLGDHQICKELLKENFYINVTDNKGNTPLIHAVMSKQIKLIKLFSEYKARMDLVNKESKTAFIVAMELEDLSMLKMLVRCGANAKIKYHGQTSLIFAANKGLVNIIEYLLKLGLDPFTQDVDGKRALDYAIKNKHIEIVKMLKKHERKLNYRKAS